ncbi:hypothetical protein K2X05_13900 [bacterium]|nr:hypothetical protein [bacterium]
MKEIINKVTDTIGTTITDSFLETAESIKEHFGQQMTKMNDLADAAKDKMAEQVSQLIEISPTLQKLGFLTEGIAVSMALPPAATFKFKKISEIDMSVYEKLMEESQDKLLVKNLLRALLSADQCQKRIKMGSFSVTNIEIQVGLTPGVSFQLSPRSDA